MIEYIKKPYVSPITGVTNVETGWKITRDSEGLDIIDEVPFSAEMVDRYASNILVPIGSRVYVWYRMKLSNSEEKQYVGPFEYVSRESNVTNDLKPITRIDTPTVTVADNSVASGQPNITFKSSVFRGDALDGHLATTWIIKAPSGDIITKSIKSVTNRYQLTINRVVTDIHRFSYVDVYIQHHSSNGAVSEFNVVRIDLKVFPFTYEGPVYIDNLKPYTFQIVPTNPSKPNLKRVDVVEVGTDIVVYSFTNVSTLMFTVPADTLAEGRSYDINAYVDDLEGPTYNYYPKLEIRIATMEQKKSMTYDRDTKYDIMGMTAITYTTVTHNAIGNYRIVDKEAIVRVGNSLVKIYKDGPNFTTKDITLDDAVAECLEGDFKIFNVRYDRKVLVTRRGDAIKVCLLVDVNDVLYFDPAHTMLTFPCKDIDHNLIDSCIMCLDEQHLYLTRWTQSDEIVVDLITVADNTTERLPTLDILNINNFSFDQYLPLYSDYDTITVITRPTDSDYVYVYRYNVTNDTWILSYESDDEFVEGMSYKGITLKDLSLLVTKDTTNTSELFYVDSLGTPQVNLTPVNLSKYTFSVIDTNGALYIFSTELGKAVIIEPEE